MSHQKRIDPDPQPAPAEVPIIRALLMCSATAPDDTHKRLIISLMHELPNCRMSEKIAYLEEDYSEYLEQKPDVIAVVCRLEDMEHLARLFQMIDGATPDDYAAQIFVVCEQCGTESDGEPEQSPRKALDYDSGLEIAFTRSRRNLLN